MNKTEAFEVVTHLLDCAANRGAFSKIEINAINLALTELKTEVVIASEKGI